MISFVELKILMMRQPKKDQAGPLMVRAYLNERATGGAVKPHPDVGRRFGGG